MSDDDNSNNNSDNFQENEEEEYIEMDEDRPTLIQIDRKLAKERKEEDLKALKKKRLRTDNKTDIQYDANKKQLINAFCPNIDELNDFLSKCEIREINENEINNINISKEKIFDPFEFIIQNNKKEEFKSFLNIEDITLISKKEKIDYPEKLNAIEESYLPKPQIEDKSELIKSILKKEILDVKQKDYYFKSKKVISNILSK